MKRAAALHGGQAQGAGAGSQGGAAGATDISVGLRMFLEDLSLQDLTQTFTSFQSYAQQCQNQTHQSANMKGGVMSGKKNLPMQQ